ncbi:hypothetical protein CBW65_18645 [Tumebacillus avium]|uniref:Uncharacterized protein n=1 Tax=Tumebacillus avium TaxID=1903704 RepID=A0A1Y0IQG0_9BACL|nr:Ger(x)C family spore germination protein [Tumebacillus avium]ARU62761.1 hypothetical protein CBW65_18645 [Tumebacillus avium]
MKRKLILLLLLLALLATGCGTEGKSLEQMSLSLAAAVDADENDRLVIYQSNPIFSQTGQGKSHILKVESGTVRQARDQMQLMSTGTIRGGKLQVMLIGKKVIETRSAGAFYDSFLRDAKNPSNVTMALVDGPVKEIMIFRPKDHHLGSFVHELIETANKEGSTVETMIRQLHDQAFEPGITAAVAEIAKKGNTIAVKGTALLNKQGLYAGSLNREESLMLLFLQDEAKRKVSYSVGTKGPSMNIALKKHKVRTNWSNGAFQFEIKLKFNAEITEVVEDRYRMENAQAVGALITKELQQSLQKLVGKLQELQVDPIGLGLYARASEYKHWKTVEHDWPAAFSKAKIKVTPEVTIENYGVIK